LLRIEVTAALVFDVREVGEPLALDDEPARSVLAPSKLALAAVARHDPWPSQRADDRQRAVGRLLLDAQGRTPVAEVGTPDRRRRPLRRGGERVMRLTIVHGDIETTDEQRAVEDLRERIDDVWSSTHGTNDRTTWITRTSILPPEFWEVLRAYESAFPHWKVTVDIRWRPDSRPCSAAPTSASSTVRSPTRWWHSVCWHSRQRRRQPSSGPVPFAFGR
jgi:hypothetical protein